MPSAGSSVQVVDNWIGDSLVPPSSGLYAEQINPATGVKIADVALSSTEDVAAAVAAAQQALPAWQKLTVKARTQLLYQFRHLLLENQDLLAKTITLEHGKTYGEAVGEIQKGVETLEYACSLPQVVQGKNLDVSTGVSCSDRREPLGIVVSIVPFNFPFMVPFWTLPISICLGNVMIIKPSEKVSLTLQKVVEIAKRSGIPSGVIQLINGKEEAVNALVDHPNTVAISFVGSSKVAEIVSKRGRALNKRVLALGAAKNHLVALSDCNKEMASSDIVASFTGCSGQRCMAASVLLLVTQQDDLLQLIVSKASKLEKGQNTGQVGPLIDNIAQKRVLSYINEAEKTGAKILVDGRNWAENTDGFWVGPTVILHYSAQDRAIKEEIFGPVLSIFVTESKEEAIAIENASPYGNAACIYTTVGHHADWFTSRFHAGQIGVNIGVPVPREPFSFGGWNASKFGDMDITGDGGVEFFTKRRKITTKWTPVEKKSDGDWMS